MLIKLLIIISVNNQTCTLGKFDNQEARYVAKQAVVQLEDTRVYCYPNKSVPYCEVTLNNNKKLAIDMSCENLSAKLK